MTTPSRKLRHSAVILMLRLGGQTDRQTDLGIKAPSRSLKILVWYDKSIHNF